ncbi:serpin family protein [Methanolobus sp.]|uniref:serpin family protein n=1 Tax=Methanolobus sp. TaxID=1874737 RepID=UPI0025E5A690|nr:serpin family protein [Methanolobus sp.]
MHRKKIIILMFFCSLSLLCVGCVENSNSDTSQKSISTIINTDVFKNGMTNTQSTLNAKSVEDYDIAAANNAFAFDMYSMVKNNDDNIFFSPHSIFTAIAICYDGAEGTTKEQIANVFYFPLDKPVLEVSLGKMIDEINSETDDYELETANALWIQKKYPVKEQYISNVDNYYFGKVEKLDFVGQPENSRNTINDWVEERTKDKIKDLVPSSAINDKTRLIITNAIYFNGKWKTEFDKQDTKDRNFYPSEDDEILVDVMYTKQYFNYGEGSNAKIVELSYKGNDLSMYVVLPDENDIDKFENGFSVKDYEKLKSNMDSKYEVKTWIPKFKFETKTDLSESLKNMGAVDAFDFSSANFSGIYDADKILDPNEKALYITQVIHQAFIDVQEEGTEAAAATYVEMCVPDEYVEPKPVPIREFKADHPFMFFIEDKRTGCILFMGKVESPEYE